jgi:hypothetical protein
MRYISENRQVQLYRILGQLALILVFLNSAHARKRKVLYKIIIPHECITSDVVCRVDGSKEMRCNFDKFKNCERIQK